MENIEQLQFPVGKLQFPASITEDIINESIQTIAALPELLKEKTAKLSAAELAFKYRPEGWSILQVVHHLADSHMNSFLRFKHTLTEDSTTIKPYFEAKWAVMSDVLDEPIEFSQKIIEGVHHRWVTLMKSMEANDFEKFFIHPEHGRTFTLAQNTYLYAWHCRHHLAHIDQALEHKF